MNLKFCMLLKVKGDEDVGVKVRVRVQKSKVCDERCFLLLFLVKNFTFLS